MNAMKKDRNTAPIFILSVKALKRFFARTIDYSIGGIVVGLLITHINIFDNFLVRAIVIGGVIWRSDSLRIPLEFILGYLVILVWGLVEAIMLSTWGTTPGKWVFRITLRNSNGEKLTFPDALKRSILVLSGGLGLGLPIVFLVTCILSYADFIRKGITYWDNKGKYVISYGSNVDPSLLSRIRIIIMTFFLINFVLVCIHETNNKEINRSMKELSQFLDENPLITVPITEGPSKGKHKVVVGGNIIRGLYSPDTNIYTAIFFQPHTRGGIWLGVLIGGIVYLF
jgi:uncharacterized RDD family membrane protein YckC